MKGRAPLYVTRKFPPSVGGMQTLAAGIWRSLSLASPGSRIIANTGSNARLPWWLPLAALKLAALRLRGRVNFVLTGDALAYAVLEPLLVGVDKATMVMGLDITHPSRLYQAVVGRALRRAPKVLAISEASAETARRLGVADSAVFVVRLGLPIPPRPTAEQRAQARLELGRRAGVPDEAVVVATLGRLVERKGIAWFVRSVLPDLPEPVHYLVAGAGPEDEAISAAVRERGLDHKVRLLGPVDDQVRDVLMSGSDLFVQPNVPVVGDMEGFGLVTIEAALRGTPVVAADLEGLKDAVVDGVTGWLLPPVRAEVWVGFLTDRVRDLDGSRSAGLRFAAAAADLYSEEAMGRALVRLLELPGA